ncbi:hypothetical protein Esti_000367 [Eimeria stiedai]
MHCVSSVASRVPPRGLLLEVAGRAGCRAQAFGRRHGGLGSSGVYAPLIRERASSVSSARLFSSLNVVSQCDNKPSDNSSSPSVQLSPWEEVEAQRPLAPDPYDGTYEMPRGAPDVRNLSRQQFHQFMKGKPQRFSKELKVAMMGVSLTVFGVGMTWLTVHLMRPDDFEWVEEERRRIQEAKDRIQRKIDQANRLQVS